MNTLKNIFLAFSATTCFILATMLFLNNPVRLHQRPYAVVLEDPTTFDFAACEADKNCMDVVDIKDLKKVGSDR